MLQLRSDLKDWEISREMMGKTTKETCKVVKNLRSKIVVEPLCEGWSTIRKESEELGWIVSNDLLEEIKGV